MIYFHAYILGADGRPAVAIAVVEDARHAARYEAQGYTRCTPAAFRMAWQLRDIYTLMQLRLAAITATQCNGAALADREVGRDRALF